MTVASCSAFASRLTINLDTVRENFRGIAQRVTPAVCAAVIKADAYGLGARRIAAALYREGCRAFFVAQLCEAFDVAEATGPDSTIYILNGLDPGCEEQCVANRFVPVLNSASQIERMRAFARVAQIPLPAALQVDSGMSRLGIGRADAEALAADERFSKDISLKLILSHLACADEPEHEANAMQLERFRAVCALFPDAPRSLANSAGVFLGPAYHQDVVRPGLALFGRAENGLRAAVSLDARIIQIREVQAGDGVGYGPDYSAPAPRRIATVGVGYADGWPRSSGRNGAAWFERIRLPIVGRVSMDSLSIDISALPTDALREGEFVELLGPSQSVDEAAHDANTISHEMLTRLGRRHQRIYRECGEVNTEPPGRLL